MIDLSKYPTLEKIRDMAMDGDRANMERELEEMRREAVMEALGNILGSFANSVVGGMGGGKTLMMQIIEKELAATDSPHSPKKPPP